MSTLTDRLPISLARRAALAAILCLTSASVLLAADPAMTPAPQTASPAPVNGEFDDYCTMGLSEGQTAKTDCSVNWIDSDGKVYCFSSEAFQDRRSSKTLPATSRRRASSSPRSRRLRRAARRNSPRTTSTSGSPKWSPSGPRTAPSCFTIPSSTPTSISSWSRSRSCAAWKAMAGSPTSSSTTRTRRRSNTPSTSGSSPRATSSP